MKTMRLWLAAAALTGCLTTSGQAVVSENVFKDITTLSAVRNTRFARPSPAGKLRKSGKPVAFYVGDSTMRTNSDGQGWNGQWGFGLFAQEWFDEDELVVENHALGGTTAETYYKNEWAKVKSGIKAGDFVVIDFGHNDKNVDTFAQYIRKYIDDVRALDATPILCSRTPRCSNGKPSADKTYRPRGMAIAQEKGVAYIDLEAEAIPMYEGFGTWKTTQMYHDGKLHTSLLGAWHNAYAHAKAIDADEGNPLRTYLKDVMPAKMDVSRLPDEHLTFTCGGDDTSARGTFRSGRWALLYNTLEKGDTVLFCFGANELKSTTSGSELGCLQTADDKNEVQKMATASRWETVYSYGWYVHYFLNDVKEKGAVGVLVNEEGVTPDKVAGWNETLATRHGVTLRRVTASGIADVEATDHRQRAHQRYNLAGQPVGAGYKGIVIVNNRKVKK
ncbi:MAG: hypothetical protein IJ176_03380 [Prevotella sp.]|nr:hypothetical protein [Prevotella sp.]